MSPTASTPRTDAQTASRRGRPGSASRPSRTAACSPSGSRRPNHAQRTQKSPDAPVAIQTTSTIRPTTPVTAKCSSSRGVRDGAAGVLSSVLIDTDDLNAPRGRHWGAMASGGGVVPTRTSARSRLLHLALALGQHLVALVRPGLGPRLAPRERQPEDRPLHHAELPMERAGVVGQLVALADLAHLGRDLAVARRRHVGVQVVLDLVAEVAADHVEQRAALDVGGADQLADVARSAGLVLGLLL